MPSCHIPARRFFMPTLSTELAGSKAAPAQTPRSIRLTTPAQSSPQLLPAGLCRSTHPEQPQPSFRIRARCRCGAFARVGTPSSQSRAARSKHNGIAQRSPGSATAAEVCTGAYMEQPKPTEAGTIMWHSERSAQRTHLSVNHILCSRLSASAKNNICSSPDSPRQPPGRVLTQSSPPPRFCTSAYMEQLKPRALNAMEAGTIA